MDFNLRNEKFEQIKWNSDDQEGSGQARSYTCAFCRKGFSNAQALGGHMNIHRRDRAKLRQSSEENLFSLDISIKNAAITTDHHESSQPLEEKILFQLESGEEKITQNCKNSRSFPEKGDDPLPGKAISSSKLDLELRLGPEPRKASTLSTREFF